MTGTYLVGEEMKKKLIELKIRPTEINYPDMAVSRQEIHFSDHSTIVNTSFYL
jgi:hypothetical protein